VFALEKIERGGRRALALALGGGHLPAREAAARLGAPRLALPEAFGELVRGWDRAWPALAEIGARAGELGDLIVRGARTVSMWSPRKIICAGANYHKHLAEMDVRFEKDPARAPFLFLKPPTALAGPGAIAVDPSIAMLDWEVELAAVIGRGGRDIPAEGALAHVAGYTVAIDLTARDRLFQPDSIFKFDFLAGKGQDGFCPTASALLPAAFLPDPQATRLALAVNGVTKQDASTGDMIYSVAELIAWASRLVELEPGDLLLTGSPEGVGFPRREFLRAGDAVRAELAPLGAFEIAIARREVRA
jgi:2-keto-4-pentenoate hydratase/2-oxohepta-3-ene-1,7-dioic acid hydratase in catechol pathway